MAVTPGNVGSLGTATTNPILGVVTPSCSIGDVLIFHLINKSTSENTFTPVGTGWTEIVQGYNSNTPNPHQYAVFWRRSANTGGSTYSFEKTTDDNLLSAGVCMAWSGCIETGSPLDATAVGVSENVSADNVTFPAFDPTRTDVHVVFLANYGDDNTTFAAAMSGDTNPDCTTRYDLETNTGSDASLACTSGSNDGSNITSRTWASSSSTDAANTGIVFALIPPSTTTTLTASSGSISLSGKTAGLIEKPVCSSGSVSLSGQVATLRKIFKIVASSGSFSLSGQVAGLKEKTVCSSGSISLSGQTATLSKVFTLTASSGSISLSGQVSNFKEFLNSLLASLTLTGQTAYLNIKLIGSIATFSLVGQDVSFKQGRTLQASQGTIDLIEYPVNFTTILPTSLGDYSLIGLSPGLVKIIVALSASFELVGNDATLIVPQEFTAESGSFSLAGSSLTLDQNINCIQGSVNLTGTAVNFSKRLNAENGSYNLTGNSVNLKIALKLVAESGNYSLSGSIDFDKVINAESGNYSLTGSLNFDKIINALNGSVTLSGNEVTLEISKLLQAETGSIDLSGFDVTCDTNNLHTLGTYNLQGFEATLLVSRILAGEQGTYDLDGKAVNILQNSIADSGGYSLVGLDVTFYLERELTASQGVYSLTGQNITQLQNTIADSGGYNLIGSDADLEFITEILLDCDLGTFALLFNDFNISKLLNAESREFYAGGPDIPEVGVSVITIARTLIRDNKPMR